MNKRRILTGMMALSFLLILSFGVIAFFSDEDESSNVITLGKVKARLVETDPVSGKRTMEGLTFSDVRPKQTVEKDPTIILASDSATAYLRVKVELEGEGMTGMKKAELLSGLHIDPSKWVYGSDGYYYYQELTNPGEETVFFNQVTIPGSWGNEISEQSIQVKLQAEAIQADYFFPHKEGGQIIGW